MATLGNTIARGVFASRPAASEPGRIYFSSDTGKTYRDNGSSWDDVSDTAPVTSIAGRTGDVVLAESDITGLTTDLSAKAPLASPTFTGTPTAPTPTAADNSTKLATTAYVDSAVSGTAPGTVTSVGLSAPSWLSVSGSPVTNAGTLALTAATGQTANLFLATPNGSSGAASLRSIAQADMPAQPVDIPIEAIGKPGAGATLRCFPAARALSIPANFGGAYGFVDPVNGANPTATATITLKKYSSGGLTTLGTMTVSTSGVFTFATTGGSAQSLAAGDLFLAIAPNPQDSTLANFAAIIPTTR